MPSNRQNKNAKSLAGNAYEKRDQGEDDANQGQWGLKVDKINSSVSKFRKHNLNKKRSKEIKISGVTSKGMSSVLHQKLNEIGEIIELKMKWLNRGDMQVKFKHEESAKKAMELFDGMEMEGTKLQVTQVFQLLPSFKPKFGKVFRQTCLQQIKEDEDSSEGEKASSSENDKNSPQALQKKLENHKLIERNINDLIDSEVTEEKSDTKGKEKANQLNLQDMGLDSQFSNNQNWEEDFQYYNQEDMSNNYDQNYQMNHGIMPNSHYPKFDPSAQSQFQGNLFRTNSSSSIGNIEHNLSYSEDGESLDFLNRTQSVRMFPNPVNSAGMNSILNNSNESGVIGEEEDARCTSRSFISTNSRGSNPHFQSACARTFASSGGVQDLNNSQMQLTPDMHNMHSSFDLGNGSTFEGYRLTPRQYSDFSFRSNPYNQYDQYNSFHGFTSNLSDQYGNISYDRNPGMRTSYSVASLDCGKAYSNPGENYKELSVNSSDRFRKKNKGQNKNKGVRKRCPVQGDDEKLN